MSVSTIKNRKDFLALRKGARVQTPGFLMVGRKNADNGEIARLGLTVTRRIGGAVVRNRIKRRLRAVASEVFPGVAHSGTDYVLIARKAAYDRNYSDLLDDMKHALLRLSSITK